MPVMERVNRVDLTGFEESWLTPSQIQLSKLNLVIRECNGSMPALAGRQSSECCLSNSIESIPFVTALICHSQVFLASEGWSWVLALKDLFEKTTHDQPFKTPE
jgi:hypothetical protein